eukprot:scaffold39697_cov56-Phaeocystis_antarctica.AAC.2
MGDAMRHGGSTVRLGVSCGRRGHRRVIHRLPQRRRDLRRRLHIGVGPVEALVLGTICCAAAAAIVGGERLVPPAGQHELGSYLELIMGIAHVLALRQPILAAQLLPVHTVLRVRRDDGLEAVALLRLIRLRLACDPQPFQLCSVKDGLN